MKLYSLDKRKIKIHIPQFFTRNYTGNGNMYVVILLTFVLIAAALLSSGFLPIYLTKLPPPDSSKQAVIVTPSPEPSRPVLQLLALPFELKQPVCAQEANVIALVDVSGSMSQGNPTKISQLKSALTILTSTLTDASIFGLYSFSVSQTEVVRTSLYGDIKAQVPSAIQSLSATGFTHTRDAFAYMQQRISEAQQQFPGKQFTFIFFSDGIPESSNRTCVPTQCATITKCFETTQDPTNTSLGPDFSAQIKNAGVTIFTIALTDPIDSCWNTQLQIMMNNIASPNNAYSTSDPSALPGIFTKVLQTVCQQ